MKKAIRKVLSALLAVLIVIPMFVTLGLEARADGGVTLKFHFYKEDGDYAPWSVWLWEQGRDGADYAFADENGEKVATMELTPGTMSVGFIVRTEGWDKDISDDQFIDISEMVSGTVHIYVKSKVPGYTKTYGDDAVCGVRLKSAVYDGENTVTVTMTGEIEGDFSNAFSVNGTSGNVKVNECVYEGNCLYKVTIADKLNVFRNYKLTYDGLEYVINMPNVYSSEEFENEYTYTGSDLGATWSKESTIFKVWAPTADKVSVKLYEKGDARITTTKDVVSMSKGEQGTWNVTVQGDLNGVYYTYLVNLDGKEVEACDPYARTTGINGDRAMVIDLESTNPAGWENDKNPHAGEAITDAIIYEAHVRDLTTESGAGIDHVGKFLGVIESGTIGKGKNATGLNHLKELGITHLHLLPVFDFGSVNEFNEYSDNYNWGYDPVNFNVPEGSYSTDPQNGAVRVAELKTMVKGLHDNGISVVMDVVYNHVHSAGDFCFNKIVPGYFSRINSDGSYSNGSGCGNDTASERSMVRKYIVESVCYWAEEYHIDGFRFDLVGLLDTETVNEIVAEVHKTHPDVIFYGEGWSLTTNTTKQVALATMFNSDKVNDFSFFNDTFRDGLKGSVFNTGTGFVSGAQGYEDKITKCFIGADSWCQNPIQSINYASCHDNNTLFDRITLSREDASKEEVIKMNNLAASLYMLSEGVPFMQAGEEMLRSKVNADGTFNSNSYNAGDKVNTIKYSSLDEKDTAAVFEYYKGLIAFRKAHKALRLTSADEVMQYVSALDMPADNMVGFEINGGMEGESAEKILLLFNAGEDDVTVSIPDGDWNICINDKKAGTKSLGKASDKVTVNGVSTLVLVQGNVEKAGGKAGLIAGICGGAAVLAGALFMLLRKKK